MSALNDYIEYAKEKTKGLNELEKIRFVYMDLGKRFGFDLKYSSGNTKSQKEVFQKSKTMEYINDGLENKNGVCISIALTISYVLNALGIDCVLDYMQSQFDYTSHAYNVITLKDGTKFSVDLQRDLANIQAHATTRFFGKDLETGENKYSRFELEQIDRKIGYVSDENYYSDDYLYLLKSDMGLFEKFSERAEFIITNLEPELEDDRKYLELKWHHEYLLKQLFTKQELNKVKQIDCYFNKRGNKDFQPCIYVDSDNRTDIYLYDSNEQRYKKVSMEDFAQKIDSGLILMQGIPRLKNFLNKRRNDDAR